MASEPQTPPAEPTFDDAQTWWTKMRRPVTFPGVPGHPFQPSVLWNAGLVFSPLLYSRPGDSLGLKLSGPPGLMRELEGFEPDALQVQFSFGNRLHLPDRADNTTGEITQELLEGRTPIILSRLAHEGLEWTEMVFCRLLRGREARTGKEDLLTEVCWTARNASSEPRRAQLNCHLAAPHVTLGYKVALAERALPYQRTLNWASPLLRDDRGKARLAAMTEGDGTITFHRSLPEDLQRGTESPLADWGLAQDVVVFEAELSAGESASFRLVIPFFAAEPGVLGKALGTSFDAALRRTRSYWLKELAAGGSIDTPEQIVNDSFDAYLCQAMLATGRKPRSGHWILKTSPNNYEALWGAHASIAGFSLDLRGKHRLSRHVFETFLANQGPIPDTITRLFGDRPVGDSEGFSDHPGFLGNIEGHMAVLWSFYHGWTLWAIGQHARLTGDWDWLKGHADRLALACDWVAEQRGRTRITAADGAKVLSYGLLPAANAFDWGFGHMFWSDAHTYSGLKEIADCLARIGHTRAAEIQHEAEAYRQDIVTAVARCRDAAPPVPLDDGSTIPFIPMSVEMSDYFAPDWTYVACGPLHLAWAGVVPHDHELIGQTLAFLDAGRPLGEWDADAGKHQGWDWGSRTPADDDFLEATRPRAGRCFFWRHKMTYEPGWIPQGFVFMGRDDMPALLEHLYSLISHGGQHVDLRSPVEQRDGVAWTQPGQANLLWLMRNMLVREDGGTLVLAGSCPRDWLADGKQVGVRSLPSRFGVVSYRVESHAGERRIVASFSPEFREKPERVLLRLRHPTGAAPTAVTIQGKQTEQAGSEWVALPGEPCVVEAEY